MLHGADVTAGDRGTLPPRGSLTSQDPCPVSEAHNECFTRYPSVGLGPRGEDNERLIGGRANLDIEAEL